MYQNIDLPYIINSHKLKLFNLEFIVITFILIMLMWITQSVVRSFSIIILHVLVDMTVDILKIFLGIEMLQVTDTVIKGVPVRVYNPFSNRESERPAIVFFHGGGWVLCSVSKCTL